jgi:2,3-bisphosphoglycerate-independent phosphoglycerate mutase
MVLPDHLTPISVRTHVSDPVPFLVCGAGVSKNGAAAFSESQARRAGLMMEKGYELLPAYLRPLMCS